MDKLSAIIDFLIVSVFSELFAVYFLLGLAVFLVGLALLALFVLSRTLGYSTTGTVAGAVEVTRIKRKERDGKVEEKLKKMLYPVFDYTTKSGKQTRMRASEGGTATLSYTTGQSVNLRVREDDGYDDVYDAGRLGALYFGLVTAAIGIWIMSSVGSAIAAIGVSFSTIVLVLFAFLVRGLLDKFDTADASKGSVAKSQGKPYNKDFDPADLHPIEHFKTAD